MDVQIRMPDLATTASEITIIRWLVEVGQSVRLGQPLLEIETDKASMEVESVAEGVLKAVQAQAGDQVAVGQVIALIGQSVEPSPGMVASDPDETQEREKRPITQVGLDIAAIRTTTHMSDGRKSLFARNKERRVAASVTQAARAEIVLDVTQREVARRMQLSKQTIPHFYLNTSANAEGLAAQREAARQNNAPVKLHWDAFFVYAAARAIAVFDRMRYHYEGDRLVGRDTDAIGVAADIDDTLYVIPIEAPLTLSLAQISDHLSSVTARIRAGDPAAKRLKDTCLTITNLGAEGIESFMAIINPPESAILAIGRVAPTVWPDGDKITIQKRVALSLSVDHRIANGKYAARFLSRIVSELEAL